MKIIFLLYLAALIIASNLVKSDGIGIHAEFAKLVIETTYFKHTKSGFPRTFDLYYTEYPATQENAMFAATPMLEALKQMIRSEMRNYTGNISPLSNSEILYGISNALKLELQKANKATTEIGKKFIAYIDKYVQYLRQPEHRKLTWRNIDDLKQRKMAEGLGLFYGLYNTAYWVILDHVEPEQIQKEPKIVKLGLWLEEIMKLILKETEKMRQQIPENRGETSNVDSDKKQNKTTPLIFTLNSFKKL